jgi:pyruvate dehydrogenase E1 component
VSLDYFHGQTPDPYPDETQEWLEALDDIVARAGEHRARNLVRRVVSHASERVGLPRLVQTDYINSIPVENQPDYPGDAALEARIRRIIRWNAAIMVLQANKLYAGIGGHLATYASAATLYEVAFNHFLRGKDHPGGGDQVYFQGHGSPGIYSRAFLEGRLTQQQLEAFRREVAVKGGLSSYPHPRLMPDFWEFPTVSMGLSPITAIYQARFNKYLNNRGIKDTSQQRVWAFLGDGEMDEPESVGALHLAASERLDNLIFVINCNLQRLDGPVRGNSKIIQQLEALLRGAGWHVIKVIWGREWDELLAKDVDGVLVDKMNKTLDGEFQRYVVEDGSYIREHFFGPDPLLSKIVEHLSDEEIQAMRRGGHDPLKVYAAYKLATELKDAPVAILAKTVKGWALGSHIAGRMATHQIKKMEDEDLEEFAERLGIEISEKQLRGEEAPFYYPGENSEEAQYAKEMRLRLGGFLPERRVQPKPITLPGTKPYETFDTGTEERKQEVSTTTAFVRLLRDLMRDKEFGRFVVPIIPDEARTFGMESLFKDFKIYAPMGQLYEPADAQMVLSYREARDGQILEEGITEAGSMGSFTAAGTSYATHGQHMVPFFMFYSMFGFQRIGDLIWAFGDARGRGFLVGCTAGRTTLSGEGLQHEDGHSHILASTVPNCRAYDPAFAYETAAVVRDGLSRMIEKGEDAFYYLTLYNEGYVMPAKPKGVDEGIIKGLYLFRKGPKGKKHKAQLFGSGSILATQVLKAQNMLAEHDVSADVWSATSYKLLREEALETERWNRLHPEEPPKVPYVTSLLEKADGPVIAASDWIKQVPDQIARWVTAEFVPLGTDGYGRSDNRDALRRHFEVDAESIVVATLSALARSGDIKPEAAAEAIERYGIDPERADPRVS